MRLLKKFLAALAGIALALALAVTLLPWSHWLDGQLRAALKDRGLERLDFTIDHVGFDGITFSKISMGPQSPFMLDSVTLGYAISDLLSGKVQGLHTGAFTLKQQALELHAGGLDIDIMPSHPGDPALHGTWSVRDITVKGLPLSVPPLVAKGALDWVQGTSQLRMNGRLQSADNNYMADFSLDYPLNNSDAAVFNLTSAQMPWNGGMVYVNRMSVPVFSTKPIQLTLLLDSVSLNALMQQATGGHASATGAMSGDLPITLQHSGAITIGQGNLNTTDQGTISLPPDVIPGDHPQVEVVRQILQDFHYTDFSITLLNGQSKKLSMLLSLKGNNPQVYNGRMVDLNVTLSGDLLDLLQQGMVTIVDPKQLLTKGKDAKH